MLVIGTVAVLIVFSVGLEQLEEYVNEETEEDFLVIIEALYGELTTMGVIGFMLFLAQHSHGTDELAVITGFQEHELDEIIENIHMALFVVMACFLTSTVYLASRTRQVVAKYKEWEICSFDQEQLLRDYATYIVREEDTGPKRAWKNIRLFFGLRAEEPQRASYVSIRQKFIYYDCNSADVDERFDFSEYVSIIIGKHVANMVSVTPLSWIVLFPIFVIAYFLYGHAGNDQRVVNLELFGVLLLGTLHYIHTRVLQVEASFCSTTLTHKARKLTKSMRMGDGGTTNTTAESLQPRRKSTFTFTAVDTDPSKTTEMTPLASSKPAGVFTEQHRRKKRESFLISSMRNFGSLESVTESDSTSFDETSTVFTPPKKATSVVPAVPVVTPGASSTASPAKTEASSFRNRRRVSLAIATNPVLASSMASNMANELQSPRVSVASTPRAKMQRANRASQAMGIQVEGMDPLLSEAVEGPPRAKPPIRFGSIVTDVSVGEEDPIEAAALDQERRQKQAVMQELRRYTDSEWMIFTIRLLTLMAAAQMACMILNTIPFLLGFGEGPAAEEGILDDTPLLVRLLLIATIMIPPIVVVNRVPMVVRDMVLISNVGQMADRKVLAEVTRRQKTQVALRSLRLVFLMRHHARDILSQKQLSSNFRTLRTLQSDAESDEMVPGRRPGSPFGAASGSFEDKGKGMTFKEAADLRAIFRAFVTDQSGFMTREGLDNLMLTVNCGDEELTEALVEVIDENGDGIISEEEFLEWAVGAELNHNLPVDEVLDGMFEIIDSDCSGEITLSELRDFMRTFGCEMQDHDLIMFMRGVDENGDHQIDREEFEIIVRSLIPFIDELQGGVKHATWCIQPMETH